MKHPTKTKLAGQTLAAQRYMAQRHSSFGREQSILPLGEWDTTAEDIREYVAHELHCPMEEFPHA